jgi:tripartite-type tricarboxylate transporter receptor subunit TctC
MEKISRRAALGFSLAALSPLALAQSEWPARPIMLVLGFAAGGPNDLVARAMAVRLSEQLKQQVLVDNKPGANGNIAAGIVARAAPDGYTFLYNSSSLALNAALMAKMPLDPLRDLTPVNGTATLPLVCVVEASFPANNFREWAAQLRANPGKFNYGTPGIGNLTHLVGTMTLKANGLSAVMTPYKGSSEALQGLLGGSTHFQFDSVNSPLQLIRAGKVKPLFVLSSQRSPVLPDVPTLAESGAKNIDSSAWQGVMAPPKTPSAIVERFAAEIVKAMANPEMKATLAGQGAYAIASTPKQYAAFFAEEIATYKRIGEEIGIKME